MTISPILEAARTLFSSKGYAATSLEEIAAKARVTAGAIYHQFDGKRQIFRMVYEMEQRRLTEIEMAAYAREHEPWEALHASCRAFLETSLDPEVQRITLLDAPAALGWDSMREIEAGAVRLMQEALEQAMNDGSIPRRPAEPMACLLFGALCEAAMKIAIPAVRTTGMHWSSSGRASESPAASRGGYAPGNNSGRWCLSQWSNRDTICVSSKLSLATIRSQRRRMYRTPRFE